MRRHLEGACICNEISRERVQGADTRRLQWADERVRCLHAAEPEGRDAGGAGGAPYAQSVSSVRPSATAASPPTASSGTADAGATGEQRALGDRRLSLAQACTRVVQNCTSFLSTCKLRARCLLARCGTDSKFDPHEPGGGGHSLSLRSSHALRCVLRWVRAAQRPRLRSMWRRSSRGCPSRGSPTSSRLTTQSARGSEERNGELRSRA